MKHEDPDLQVLRTLQRWIAEHRRRQRNFWIGFVVFFLVLNIAAQLIAHS